MPDDAQSQTQVQVKVPDHHNPLFANSVQINVSDEEVVLQFIFVRRGSNQGTLVSEIVITPQHAIKLQKAIDDTVKKHFTKHIN